MDKYTTQTILDAIKLDATIDKDIKKAEEAKTILPTETFALCDTINDLVISLKALRANLK